MPTYQIVDTPILAGSAVTVITRDPALEAIAQIPDILEWIDPATIYRSGAASTWRIRDKRRGILGSPFATNAPDITTINGQPALYFGAGAAPAGTTTNGSLIFEDTPMLGSAYSVAFGAQVDAGGSGDILGAALQTDAFSITISSTTGFLTILNRTNTAFDLRPSPDRRTGTPFVGIVGFDGAGRMTLRVNGAQVGQVFAAPTILNTRLRLGGHGLSSTLTPAILTRVGQVLTFGGDLTAASRAADLAKVENLLRGLYGV